MPRLVIDPYKHCPECGGRLKTKTIKAGSFRHAAIKVKQCEYCEFRYRAPVFSEYKKELALPIKTLKEW